jgi:hypothetical protein
MAAGNMSEVKMIFVPPYLNSLQDNKKELLFFIYVVEDVDLNMKPVHRLYQPSCSSTVASQAMTQTVRP